MYPPRGSRRISSFRPMRPGGIWSVSFGGWVLTVLTGGPGRVLAAVRIGGLAAGRMSVLAAVWMGSPAAVRIGGLAAVRMDWQVGGQLHGLWSGRRTCSAVSCY